MISQRSIAPQQSAMQTPQAPGGQRGKPTAGRRSPRPDRHVLFTDDAQGRKKQELVPIFGGKSIATNENGDLESLASIPLLQMICFDWTFVKTYCILWFSLCGI